MCWGGNPTLYNGTIVVYGANSISSSVMTTYPVTDISVRIDKALLKAIDDKLDILGATIDVTDMYIVGDRIMYEGKTYECIVDHSKLSPLTKYVWEIIV